VLADSIRQSQQQSAWPLSCFTFTQARSKNNTA
jgi:hypothetical protein